MTDVSWVLQLCLVVDAYLSEIRETSDILMSEGQDNYRCIVMGLVLHYFFLAQFMWIVVQVALSVCLSVCLPACLPFSIFLSLFVFKVLSYIEKV